MRTLLTAPTGQDSQLVRLAQLIVYREDRDYRTRGWSDAELARAVRANIAADHTEGRIVDANCWQLSATEARALELMQRLRAERIQAQT